MKKILAKMQEQITSLEAKIDILITRSAPRPVEAKPFQQPANTNGQAGTRQGNNFRERVLHKTICADCRKECEVPFKPTGGRPVYCKDCFSKRKAAGVLLKNRPGETVAAPVMPVEKPKATEKKKAVSKKKKAVSKKKKK